jgi:hypothetical protein
VAQVLKHKARVKHVHSKQGSSCYVDEVSQVRSNCDTLFQGQMSDHHQSVFPVARRGRAQVVPDKKSLCYLLTQI